MENMLLIAGIWMIILPKMKWNMIKDKQWIRLYSSVLGIYTLFITMMSYFFTSKISHNFFIMCFILLLILNSALVIIKIKSESSNASKLMILFVFICIFLALFILYLDINEIHSSIVILTATMIILSIPYDDIKKKGERKY